MNLLCRKFIQYKNKSVKVTPKKDSILIENASDKRGFLILPKLYKSNGQDKCVEFGGNLLKGDAPILKIVNRRRTPMFSFDFNTQCKFSPAILKYFVLAIDVPADSAFELTHLAFHDNVETLMQELMDGLSGDTLLLTPGYPSESNKYNTAFVHTRAQEYISHNMSVDVLVVNSLPEISKYVFEGIPVVHTTYFHLREILSRKKYKRILVHFFDCNYGNVFDGVDLSETKLYFYVHGADVLYRDLHKYATPYFCKPQAPIWDPNILYKRDFWIKKYNEYPNVKWIFVSNFVKERAEELMQIKFHNYDIVPCYIDNKLFFYTPKSPELQKKVFVLRKFTNDFCYALDIDVRAILELSRRPCFSSMEFDIYGNGSMFEILTKPLKGFSNVHLHQRFLTHNEIKEVHDTHGIALFATRFDTQGVSLSEAASSGCAVVTSSLPVIDEYIDKSLGVSCDGENYVQYADALEKLASDPVYFETVSSAVSKSVQAKFSYQKTIQKELDMFASEESPKFEIVSTAEEPVLSVIVPSYNVEKYLWHGVMSLLNQKNAGKIEVLIVDDGSKDSTAEIGKRLEQHVNRDGRPIVRLISKENGGHGSTINVGIQEARGKYTKIMDGDDTVDSLEFSRLIDILETETSDIVLNNYLEDYALDNALNHKEVYSFMVPGMQYNFDDLCHEGYGFYEWGPILACSSYKTDFLRKIGFQLSEKCFYVDVELNTNISLACQTISYYPLNIYRYLLGRNGQSISKESYMRNYKNHEHVTMKIIKMFYDKESELSDCRKEYILNMLIRKMLLTQYIISVDFYRKAGPFREFEKRLKAYPQIYNDPVIVTNKIKFHRRTGGYLIPIGTFLCGVKRCLKKILGRD